MSHSLDTNNIYQATSWHKLKLYVCHLIDYKEIANQDTKTFPIVAKNRMSRPQLVKIIDLDKLESNNIENHQEKVNYSKQN